MHYEFPPRPKRTNPIKYRRILIGVYVLFFCYEGMIFTLKFCMMILKQSGLVFGTGAFHGFPCQSLLSIEDSWSSSCYHPSIEN